MEQKLLEETDYVNELRQGKEIAAACAMIPDLRFPAYYPQWSTDKILAMDWMQGEHISEFTAHNQDQVKADKLGQALWDFYMFQMHKLRAVHADPHPGNFLVDNDSNLIAIDFGCIKQVPEEFYTPYFELVTPEIFNDPVRFEQKLYELEVLRPDDKASEKAYLIPLFKRLLDVSTMPYRTSFFDFSNEAFFGQLAAMGEEFSKDSELRKMNGNRGSKHFLYINRTFFGLYSLLHDLKARVNTENYFKYIR